ncbi:expressed unknown protein [Seminavis robusta]|uniref:Fungal lipase-type domain-containing protein n=1 Tax=Seminavis robusta TaxID=568900 RepID=A0A9N8HI01_9STRA|nr:expressed unknown protein [Seminavis robusta]|eukprot:Sro668_g184440.1 n/a (513) ;mRNA; r:46991-48973
MTNNLRLWHRLMFVLLVHSGVVLGSELWPRINGGQSQCYPVQTKDKVSGAKGLLCLRLPWQDPKTLTVDIHIGSAGWELNDVFVWLGSNETDLPYDVEDAWATANFDEFTYTHKRVRERKISIQTSLLNDMGFACPNRATEYFAAVFATVKSIDGRKSEALEIVKSPTESMSDAANLLPYTISCQRFSRSQIMPRPVQSINGQSTSAHRRQLQDCPAYPSNTVFNLTEAEMSKVSYAIKLNMLVTRSEAGLMSKVRKEQKDNYELFNGWCDLNDQALVAKPKDEAVCYACFMGTNGLNPLDGIQNLILSSSLIGDCMVRNGYTDAYNTSYRDDLRCKIDECVQSCDDGLCPLVLSGHSQGGAAAIAAAIDLRHYRPTTITFGSPRPFMVTDDAPCTDLNAEQHYRFINTDANNYDSVPYGTLSGSSNFGQVFLLDDTNWPIGYPGFNADQTRDPQSSALHDRGQYEDKILAIMDRGCFPVPAAPWGQGHYCHYDDECFGNCIANTCRDEANY